MPNLSRSRSAPTARAQPRALTRLLEVVSAPATRRLLLARTLGSLPVGMVSLGIILLLRALGDGYALAGATDGAYALGLATMQPPLGRAIDRFGMGRVLAPLALAFPAALVAFTAGAADHVPVAAMLALALAMGATLPPLGACMRVLWPGLIPEESLRAAAFAIDATLQELGWILGPPLVALIAATAGPRPALLTAGGLGAAGTAAFALLARGRHPRSPRGGGALRSPVVRRVLSVSVLLGGGFGATEVALPAFCEHHGARAAAGLLLAGLALGSACGGLAFGARAGHVAPERRLAVALAGYAVLVATLLAAPSIPVMALCVFASGIPIAPAFAGSYLLLDRFSVPGALTETFAWNTAAIVGGASVGTAAGGALIAPVGYRAAIALSIALGLACVALVAAYARGGALER